MTLAEQAALLPNATTEDLFTLILEMCKTIEILTSVVNETNGKST